MLRSVQKRSEVLRGAQKRSEALEMKVDSERIFMIPDGRMNSAIGTPFHKAKGNDKQNTR